MRHSRWQWFLEREALCSTLLVVMPSYFEALHTPIPEMCSWLQILLALHTIRPIQFIMKTPDPVPRPNPDTANFLYGWAMIQIIIFRIIFRICLITITSISEALIAKTLLSDFRNFQELPENCQAEVSRGNKWHFFCLSIHLLSVLK